MKTVNDASTSLPHSIKVSMSTIPTSEWRLCVSFGTACGICFPKLYKKQYIIYICPIIIYPIIIYYLSHADDVTSDRGQLNIFCRAFFKIFN
jgi:hypothetical protein